MNANQRVGDADRDAAVSSLREHMSAGRLTLDEFDERMTKALGAKTRKDITELFTDLPGGAPDAYRAELSIVPLTDAKAVAEGKTFTAASEKLRVIGVVIVWLAFFGAMFSGVIPWWLFFIPFAVTGMLIGDDEKQKRKQIED